MLGSANEWRVALRAAALSACLTPVAVLGGYEAQHYKIDSVQTRVRFEFRVFGVIRERGWFDTVTGSVVLNSKEGTGRLDVEIDAHSLRARNEALGRLIRGRSFLNVDLYPKLVYEARRIVFADSKPDLIDGELTMRGVTRSIPLRVIDYACSSVGVTQTCLMDANATLWRSEFGMSSYKSLASDKMLLSIRAEGIMVEGSDPPFTTTGTGQ